MSWSRSLAVTFQGGCKPRWIKLSNGQTVVAYTNGVVYTNSPETPARAFCRMSEGTFTFWNRFCSKIAMVVGGMFGPQLFHEIEHCSTFRRSCSIF